MNNAINKTIIEINIMIKIKPYRLFMKEYQAVARAKITTPE